jgi:hypothetical protein
MSGVNQSSDQSSQPVRRGLASTSAETDVIMNSIIPPRSKAHWEEHVKVRAEVRQRFEQAVEQRGFWRRLVLWWEIEREVRKEMKRRFPPGALYAR